MLHGGVNPNSTWVCLQGDIDDETFRQYFEQFGDIDDCVVRHSTAALTNLDFYSKLVLMLRGELHLSKGTPF